jgi:hypothetical protein
VADADMTVTPNGTVGYTLAVTYKGNQFAITKANGIAGRSCTVPGKGGCPSSGRW